MRRLSVAIVLSLSVGILFASIGPTSLQGDIIDFSLLGRFGPGILSENEVPGPITGGSGGAVGAGIFFDTDTNELTINVGWGSGNGFTDLSSDVNLLNIHGPTPSGAPFSFEESAPALITLSGVNNSATNGGFSGTITLDPGNVNDLFTGRLYLHIHTANNGGGEARGYFVSAVPEPGTSTIIGMTLGALAFCIRRSR